MSFPLPVIAKAQRCLPWPGATRCDMESLSLPLQGCRRDTQGMYWLKRCVPLSFLLKMWPDGANWLRSGPAEEEVHRRCAVSEGVVVNEVGGTGSGAAMTREGRAHPSACWAGSGMMLGGGTVLKSCWRLRSCGAGVKILERFRFFLKRLLTELVL